jgi:putative spermidine/putrescine transport system substrate-binding protein
MINTSTRAKVLGIVMAAAVVMTACSKDKAKESSAASEAPAGSESAASAAGGNEAAPGIKAPAIAAATAVGAGEGALNLIAWPGYTEKAWVDPFTAESGCKVNVKTAGTSDEMVQLIKTGDYDGISASGDASLRLIAAGDVAPINPTLIPNYNDVYPALKGKAWNSVGGVPYGVPHGRGANLLMFNTDKVTPAPDSWSAVFDPASPYKGSITSYDSPIYIADAALYLMKTKPELAITNPYSLDEKQLAASVELLKAQKGLVGEYWSDFAKQQAAFKAGSSLLGTSWQIVANLAKAEGTKVDVVLPKEGATGWSDTWMIAAKAKNPNCAYKWMDYIISPKANAAAVEYFGEAPSNPKACEFTTDKNHCTTFHAGDEDYFSQIYYWTTPIKECIDGRGAICTDYAQWTKAWTEIKG